MNKILTIVILILLNLILPGCKKKSGIPEKNYLSQAWAIYAIRAEVFDNAKYDESNSLLQEGIRQNKEKKYEDALRTYEKAFDLHTSGDIYYNYGNTLSNLKRFEDSTKAFEISLKLGTKRPELAMYNIACNYSLLKKPDQSYNYLANAIERGYDAFGYIKKDPDMEFLRSQPDWERKIKSFVQTGIKYEASMFTGYVGAGIPRSAYNHIFCSNGIALDPHCGRPGYTKGKWILNNNEIEISWETNCEAKGIGKVIDTECPGTRKVYENYKFQECQVSDHKLDWNHIIRKDELKDSIVASKMTQKELAEQIENGNYQYEGGVYFKKLTSKEPAQCDPNFEPKSLKDLKVDFGT